MSVEYVEILTDSRAFNNTRTSTEQTIVVEYQLPEKTDDSGELEDPAAPNAEFMGSTDDILALETAYDIFPIARWIPNNLGIEFYCILDTLKVTQTSNYDWWKAEATYKYDVNTGQGGEEPDEEAKTLSFIKIGFSVGGKTAHVKESLEVLDVTNRTINPRPLPAGDNSTIGATEDSIEGADIAAGGLSITVTAYYFPQYINFEFLSTLRDMCYPYAPTNNGVFLGFPAGEVLFLGVEGEANVADIIPLTFQFDIKKNLDNYPDPGFPVINAEGHDILDYRFAKAAEPAAKVLIMDPIFRFIHRVHDKKDFSLFGYPVS